MGTTSGPVSVRGNSPFREYPYGHLFPPDFTCDLPNNPILDKSSPEYRERCRKILITLEDEIARCYRAHDSLKKEYVDIVGQIDQLQWNLRYLYTRGEPLILDPAAPVLVWEGYGMLMKKVHKLSTERAVCEEQIQVCRVAIEHYNKLLSAGVRDIMRSNNEPAFSRVQNSWMAAELDALERKQYNDIR